MPKDMTNGVETPEEKPELQHRDHAFLLLLLVGIVAVYGQTLEFDFLLWDDPHYVSRHPYVARGLTIVGLKKAFTSLQMTHWQPLTMISHMLDVEFFGLNPGAHHGVNVLLHALNSVLVFSLLRSTSGRFWPCAFVATMFALHPLHVENVAWIADRKDLLSAFFGLLALHAYVRYVVQKRRRWYGLVLILFVLALMCKSMIVTLPIMCLLLDYWPLGRLGSGLQNCEERFADGVGIALGRNCRVQHTNLLDLMAEKIPLFVVATGFSILTYVTTQYEGWIEYYGRVSLKGRLVNSVCSHGWYIVKTLWPNKLSALYVHPDLPGGSPFEMWHIIGAVLLLGAISWAAWQFRKPYLVMGWLWFLGTLAPVNGLVQFGNPGRADHYMYVPIVGLLIMVAWGTTGLFERLGVLKRAPQSLMACAGVAVVLMAATACWVQTGYWRNSMIFYERQMKLVPDNPHFNANMALVYAKSGKADQAIYHASKALAIWPRVYQAHFVLEEVYYASGDPELARYHRQKGEEIQLVAEQEHEQEIATRLLVRMMSPSGNKSSTAE